MNTPEQIAEKWNWLKNLIAHFRLSNRIVCERSRSKGLVDYHDYPDSIEGQPWHMTELTCKRCGKKFTV